MPRERGPGLDNEADAGGVSSVFLEGTLLSGNTSGATVTAAATGPRHSGGFNLETGNACGLQTAAHDLVNTDPALGPLRFQGGPTETRMPGTSSPAINAVTAACPAADQRGVPRPVGGRCDIGALEVTAGPALHRTPGARWPGLQGPTSSSVRRATT